MSSKRLEEFADTLKKLIQDNESILREEETGKVLSNQDSIVLLSGLSRCTLNEVVLIGEEKIRAIVLAVRENYLGAVILGRYDRVAEGREAFPGDIFYLHSRLLERSGKLSEEKGGGSITALPIIQTQSDDIAAYIPSNVISITDGQLFLKTNLFNSGQRPAVDLGNSVSRVGGAAQQAAIKDMTSALKLFVSQYFELIEFSKFSPDLNEESRQKIAMGSRIMPLLKQFPLTPYSPQDEIMILFLISSKLILDIESVESVPDILRRVLESWRKDPNYSSLDLTQPIDNRIKEVMSSIFKSARILKVN
ncbi:hypothetical protein PVNG_02342 [Plasmodium vivax North Korean]|uniref:Uncharacterized protein n=1 Tax=Plasmodium vivax North Korean TaxID=1035514 RepID=A0A0J9TLL2_PLAVI|nr:hypothetical protein PVNG_02342 [Plasmodium vivax North Korean]